MAKIGDKIKSIPKKPGIYQFLDKNKKLLYIGKAKSLKNRVSSYFHKQNQLTPAKQQMVEQIKHIKYTVVDNETEALLLEKTLIRKNQPPYNIDLKDDKYFLYIKIDTKAKLPRVETVRKFVPRSGIKYFGPYTSGSSVRQTLKYINQIFILPMIKDSSYLNELGIYLPTQLDKKISSINDIKFITNYKETINNIMDFLSGDMKKIISSLKDTMTQLSNNHEFELAAVYRDRLNALEKIQIKQKVIFNKDINQDYISLYREANDLFINLFKIRNGKLIDQTNFTINKTSNLSDKEIIEQFTNQYYGQTPDLPNQIVTTEAIETPFAIKNIVSQKGNKKKILTLGTTNAKLFATSKKTSWQKESDDITKIDKALEQLKKGLKLNHLPNRIEVFDISNIQGVFAVGSMIVFTNGKADKKEYKRFKIKTVKGPNDFYMMQEVLSRRILHKDWTKPDLIILDGGKPQLSTVLKVKGIKKYNIIALAKKEEIIYTPQGQALIFKKNSPAYYLIQRMRDEAHRFAITYYRKSHKSNLTSSQLDNIKGIGPKTKKILKEKYGNWDNVKSAPKEELIKQIGIAKANIIFKT